MKSRTPNVALQFLVMKHNEHEIPEIRKLAEEIGVDRLLIKNIEVHNKQEANEWLPAGALYRRYHFDGQDLIVKGAEKKSCTRPWLSTLINWDGEVVPCCFDKNGQYPMGNIHNVNDVDTIWRGQSFSNFRERLLAERKSIDICRNCNQGFGSFLPQKLSRNKKNK
jgi:radical SAM protein with 4Fe4S-binding SPASM domain